MKPKLLGFAIAMWMAFALVTVMPSTVLSQPSDEAPPTTTVSSQPLAPVDSPDVSTGASSVAIPTVPDTVSTAEEALDLKEVLGLIQSLTALIQGKNWLGVSIVAILILTSLLKTPFAGEFLGSKIPKRYIILVPIGLGVIAGGLQAAMEGGWQNGIVTALTSGGFAVFAHEFIDRIVKDKDNTT